MISGQMSESQEVTIIDDDLLDGGLKRFICWAYTSHYSAADLTEAVNGIPKRQPSISKKPTAPELSRKQKFRSRDSYGRILKVLRKRGHRGHYTNVFLTHARLYCFTEKFDVHSLRKLILHNLQRTLRLFSSHWMHQRSYCAKAIHVRKDHYDENENDEECHLNPMNSDL